jgi:hypothetical protein
MTQDEYAEMILLSSSINQKMKSVERKLEDFIKTLPKEIQEEIENEFD